MKVKLSNSDGQESEYASLPLGCEHGRRIGQPCPHCLGISTIVKFVDEEFWSLIGVDKQLT